MYSMNKKLQSSMGGVKQGGSGTAKRQPGTTGSGMKKQPTYNAYAAPLQKPKNDGMTRKVAPDIQLEKPIDRDPGTPAIVNPIDRDPGFPAIVNAIDRYPKSTTPQSAGDYNPGTSLMETALRNVMLSSSPKAAELDRVNPATVTQSYYTQPSNATNYDQNKPVYTQSDALLAAGQAVADAEQNKPGEYQSSYNDQIQGMIDSILNQKPFQYDAAADPLYQQYAQQYQRNGELAMRDAMAQTSALTGGYGNTYAQLAGQQGYQRYMEDMNAMLPQLQQAAYQMYQDEGNTLRSNLAMLQNADQVDYGRYRDSVGDWQNELNYLYGKYSNMSQDEYNRYLNDRQSWENDRAYWYQQQQDQMNWDWMREQFEYQKQQDELARQRSSGGGSKKTDTKADWAGILNIPNVSTLGAAVGGLTAYGNNLAAAVQNTLKPENTQQRNDWLAAAAEQLKNPKPGGKYTNGKIG